MRTRSQILKDYLILLNEEKEMGYSPEQIEKKIDDETEFKVLNNLLNEELYITESLDSGQMVNSRRSFYVFCKVVIKRDLKTGDEVWNSFVRKQYEIVEMNKLVCYMAPRGHGKTFFFALYVSFKMYLLDNHDVCYCSNVPIQRRRFLRTLQKMIDFNELLLTKKDKRAVANREISWGQNEMEYNEGVLEGTTVGTTPRGGHFNLAIGDDPLRDDRKYTYEFIVNYFQGVLKPTTYRKKGRYIVVGTPQDPEDLFHTLMNDKLDKDNRPIGNLISNGQTSFAGFYSEVFPAILDEKKKIVLVPEIWTYEELMIEQIRIGEIRFNREMLCKCITHRNSLISSSLFRSVSDMKEQFIQKGEPGKKYMVIVDPATSDAPTADYCAMGVFEDNQEKDKLILRDLFHQKGFPVTDPEGADDDQIHKVYRYWKDFNKALIVIEKNNAGIALIQGIQALAAKNNETIDIIEHFTHTISTGRPTEKPGKANDVIDYIEQGLKTGVLVYPCDPEDYYTIDSYEKVKVEHLNFGVRKGKSGEVYEAIAGHDDIFDVCWMAFKFRGDQADTLPMAITLPGGI